MKMKRYSNMHSYDDKMEVITMGLLSEQVKSNKTNKTTTKRLEAEEGVKKGK